LADAGASGLMATGIIEARAEAEGPDWPRPPPRAAAATCQVIQHGGSAEVDFGRETVEGLLASGGFFWLDLDPPDPDDF
jgi:hypothetical protein